MKFILWLNSSRWRKALLQLPFPKKKTLKTEFKQHSSKTKYCNSNREGSHRCDNALYHWTTNAKPVAESVATIALSKKKRSKQSSSSIRPKQSIAIKQGVTSQERLVGLFWELNRYEDPSKHWQLMNSNDTKSARLLPSSLTNMVVRQSFSAKIEIFEGAEFLVVMSLSGRLFGLFWELNPGPLAPEARIMPLDQTASWDAFSSKHWELMNSYKSTQPFVLVLSLSIPFFYD